MKTWDNMFEGPHTFDPEAEFYTRDRSLNRQDYVMEARVPPASIRFNVEENLQGEMRARIVHHVYQEQVGVYYYSVQWPDTWVDHFKQDVVTKWGKFGTWLLDRYPIQYNSKTVQLDVQAMYPDFVPINGYGQVNYIVREMSRKK